MDKAVADWPKGGLDSTDGFGAATCKRNQSRHTHTKSAEFLWAPRMGRAL